MNSSGLMSLAPGTRLDRYELLCPIATGGMAAVWVARLRAKHGFEKCFAVKTILPENAANVRFQKMLLDEARIAAGIDHTNVAQMLDLGEEQGVLYLVMECVDGDSVGTLSSAITNSGSAFPMAVAIRIVADVCAGLHAAHELRGRDGRELHVVHRDISPQNILLNRNGVVKVIDFGIARARDRIADETLAGSIKGKIQFMAPEQAMAHAVDRRADIWAAGAVLYKLLGGRPPFDGPSKLATMQQIATGTRPEPLPVEVPRAVARVVEKALANDPAERFPTALAMRQALEAAMTETGLHASTSDVAALVATYLGERAEKRKKEVEHALREADLRDANSSHYPPRIPQMPKAFSTDETAPEIHDVPHAIAISERAVPAWATTVFPLRPRMTRRLATTALAAVGAALLLFAAVHRERPVQADVVKAPVVAAREMIPSPPISIDPPASTPLKAVNITAPKAADSISAVPARVTPPKTTDPARSKTRRERPSKRAPAPARPDAVTEYYGF